MSDKFTADPQKPKTTRATIKQIRDNTEVYNLPPNQDTEVDDKLLVLIDGYISWMDGEIVNPEGLKSALNAHYKSILLEVLDEEIPSLFEGLENRIKERLESRLG